MLQILRSILFLSAALALLLSISCQDKQDAWQRMQETGVMRVGIDPTYPPFEALMGGELVGLDVDMAQSIAKQLDLEPEFIHFGYDGLYDALLTGQVDLLISALAILPEKTEDFSYSSPYFDAGQVFVVRDGTDIDFLDSAVVAVEIGSEGHVRAKDLARQDAGVAIHTFRSAQEALESVVSLESHAAIVDSVTARLYIATNQGLALIPVPGASEPYAIVVRSEDTELLDRIDDSLKDLIEAGELEVIISSWLEGS